MPSLRPRQDEAITRIAFDPRSGGKLIVVDRTGGAKSLVLAMTAIVVGGVTIVIVPLLALMADQRTRLNAAVQQYGAVSAIHLDETSTDDLNKKIIPKMDALSRDLSSTIIFLTSPPYLARTKDFRDALLRCNAR